MASETGGAGQDDVLLVVQADDFGMCHAVNEGVVHAFTDGIVTQTSVMVPCPWFDEAASLALEHGIPVGMHQTLTCEWDHLRWRPLTPAPSLRADDGTFHRTLAAVREHATPSDEMRSICKPDAHNVAWAEQYRAADVELLCDPSIRARVDDLGIRLVSLAEASGWPS